MARPDDIRAPGTNDGSVGIFSGNTRPQGDGFIGGGYQLYRIVPGSGGAEIDPASRQATSIMARLTADVEWVAIVCDAGDETAAKVVGRTYKVAFGRWVEGGGAPKIPANFAFPVTEDVVEASAARPDLTRLQPAFGDWVYAYVSDMGDVAAGEFVWIFFKFTNRRS